MEKRLLSRMSSFAGFPHSMKPCKTFEVQVTDEAAPNNSGNGLPHMDATLIT